MQGEVSMKRFRLAPAVVAVLIGLVALVFAGSAGAYHTKNATEKDTALNEGANDEGFNLIDPPYLGFDPMETSVPYLAWRGEEVRLVKCFDRTRLVRETGRNLNQPLATAEWQVMEWSGDQFNWPKFYDDLDQETGRFVGFGDQSGRDCFAIDITSHKAGIATVKMSIDADDLNGVLDDVITPLDPGGNALIGEGDPVAKHQFVVIWMSLRRPILRCLDGGTGCPGAGPITENPLDRNRLGALVKGDVPLTDQFRTELGAQNSALDTNNIVLPDAWEALSTTTLASISHGLRISNNGVQNDTGLPGPDDDDVNDGRLTVQDSPSLLAGERWYREPTHSAGDFWDIHDSTGPLNDGVYAPDQELIVDDFCSGEEESDHNAVCHVAQNPDSGNANCAGNNDPVANGPNSQPAPGGNGRDTVDNCKRSEWGPFSRVFHDVSAENNEPTIGPFTNTRPDETLLSDSEVNAHDAPMPAAVIVASIAPNTGTGIGGVGFLTDVDKHEAYNRGGDACEDPRNEHCVIGPFSGAYIPPAPAMERNPAGVWKNDTFGQFWTDDPDVGSGIIGSFANNFDGYLPVRYPQGENLNRGTYHYWDIIETTRFASGGDLDPGGICEEQGFRTPTGPQEIVLYTDEHGEAQFQFNAGEEFFLGGFLVGVVQRSCTPRDLLGTADITASARYPFQPHTHAGQTSNVLQKRIVSLFDKGIICVPKSDPEPELDESDDKALCIVFARDFAGRPITDEVVCVNFEGGTEGGGINELDSDPPNNPPSEEDIERENKAGKKICLDLEVGLDDAIEDLLPGPNAGPNCPAPDADLDGYGTDVLLVDLQGGPIEATAEFVDENIERSCVFFIPPQTGTPAPVTGTGQNNGGGSANGVGGQSSPGVVLPGGKVLVDGAVAGGLRANGSSRLESQPSANRPAAAKKLARIMFVRIVKPLRQGAVRSVILRVKSPNKTARITLRLIGKRGKVIGTMLRTVKTNRTVRVPNLRVPTAVTNVRVKLIA
jgi:hypothetical protein